MSKCPFCEMPRPCRCTEATPASPKGYWSGRPAHELFDRSVKGAPPRCPPYVRTAFPFAAAAARLAAMPTPTPEAMDVARQAYIDHCAALGVAS